MSRESPFRRDVPSYVTMRSPQRAASQCALQCTSPLSRSIASLGQYDNLTGAGRNKLDTRHVTNCDQQIEVTSQRDITSDSSGLISVMTASSKVTPTKVSSDASVTNKQGPTNAYWDYSQPIMLQESCVWHSILCSFANICAMVICAKVCHQLSGLVRSANGVVCSADQPRFSWKSCIYWWLLLWPV